MKKEDKGKKNFNLKTVGKGTTLAAMVAALGISLGTEIKNVYAQGNDLNSSSKLKLEGSLALKLETGGSQEIKLTNQIISGRIVSISGNQVTIVDTLNKKSTYSVSLSSGGNVSEYLSSHYQVGGSISGKIVNGKLVLQDVSSR
jgi:hypothetical protein